ncbi:hypothetical protein [Ewingella americana]
MAIDTPSGQFGWQPKVLTLNLKAGLGGKPKVFSLGGNPRSSVWVATQGFDLEFESEFKSRLGRQPKVFGLGGNPKF